MTDQYESFRIEAKNAAALEIVLIDLGYVPARPAFDAGIDLLAYRPGETLAIQLKGRATIDRKYLSKGVHIAWRERANATWYMIGHDALVSEAEAHSNIAHSASWTERGLSSWPKAPSWLLEACTKLQ